MQIVKVKINNFRCIKNIVFNPANHNIIIGRVNSGKSTLLNAISLVLDPDVSRRYRPVDELDFFEGKTLDKTGEPIPMQIEVTLSYCTDEEQNSFFEYWEVWDTDKKNLIENSDDISILDNKQNKFAFRIGFQAKYDLNEREIVHYWYYPKFSFHSGSDEYRTCYRPDREKIGYFLIPAERDISKALSFTRYSALDKALRADKINLENEVVTIAGKVRGFGGHLFDNKDFETLIKEIESQVENMLELSPEIVRKLTFELSGLRHYDIMNVLKAFVQNQGAPQPYPVTNQGMGAKQVITLATLRMLAARKNSCMLGIEEPENSLHPHMQRSLVRDLLRANCQTFITTHSVHVAQVADQKNVYAFLDEGSGVKKILNTYPTETSGYTKDTLKSINRIMWHYPSDVLDSLFSPRTLLVEGPGDREAVPVLIRKLSDSVEGRKADLDGLGIAIVPSCGKQEVPKISPYYKFLGKTVYALVDDEKGSDTHNQNIISACECSFFWGKNTAIEKVLVQNASEATLDSFIEQIEGLGDSFFSDSDTKNKNYDGKKQDVMRCLKKRHAHRHFAELLPLGEISQPVKYLWEKLELICSNKESHKEIILYAPENS
jgi:putative ATP-dependent endonuclease of OLD family